MTLLRAPTRISTRLLYVSTFSDNTDKPFRYAPRLFCSSMRADLSGYI